MHPGRQRLTLARVDADIVLSEDGGCLDALEVWEALGGDLTALNTRRQRYLADAAYLARQGIEPGRLTAMLEES